MYLSVYCTCSMLYYLDLEGIAIPLSQEAEEARKELLRPVHNTMQGQHYVDTGIESDSISTLRMRQKGQIKGQIAYVFD